MHATIVAGDDESLVIIDGLPNKGTGAVVGSAVGGGGGLGVGILSCLGTGFLFPACISVVVPASIVASAVGGGVYGAVATQSNDDVEEKRSMLTEVINELGVSQRLAALVRQKALEDLFVDQLTEEKETALSGAEWMLRIVVYELATIGSGPDIPYSIKASARVEITSSGNDKPVFAKDYQDQSLTNITTAEWRANDNEKINTTVDILLAELATIIANDLIPSERKIGMSSNSANSLISPVEPYERGDVDSNNQTNLFDYKTVLNWIILPSSPVSLDTAKTKCAAIQTDDSLKYRLPSLHDFEELWKDYKEDERIKIFNRKEYNTSDQDSLTRFGYSKTFSFEDGTTGNLYAAYLACVNK